MIAVICDPNQPSRIVQTFEGALKSLKADGRPYVEVGSFRLDYDRNFEVVDGKVQPKAGFTP